MTTSDALHLLELTESDRSNLELIKQRYSTQFNELNTRLTNIPNERLKKKYRKKLDQLEEARNLLLGDSIKSDREQQPNDLPRSSPVAIQPQILNRQSAQQPGENGNKKTKKTAIRKWLLLSIVLLLASLAVNIWLYQQYQRPNEQLRISKNIENGTLLIKNLGEDDIIITHLTIWYLDSKDQWKTYEIKSHTLKGGGRLDGRNYGPAITGAERKWSGEVIFYKLEASGKAPSVNELGLFNELIELNLDAISNSPNEDCGKRFVYNGLSDSNCIVNVAYLLNDGTSTTPTPINNGRCVQIKNNARTIYITTSSSCSTIPRTTRKISANQSPVMVDDSFFNN